MPIFSNRDKEILSDANNLLREKVTVIGSDGYSFSEPYTREKTVPLSQVLRFTPDGYNNNLGLVAPNYDDYPVEGAIGTRQEQVRLHSYLPSGLSGPDSCQAFFAISVTPTSNYVGDIDAARMKPLVSSSFSPRKTNAANSDTFLRGFELALYPARNNAGVLEADTSNGPISPLADPGAASSSDAGAGANSDGFWSVDYENGVVRFSRPPLNGSTGVMNPNNVFGDINGNRDPSGAITMFATFYEYTGEFGVADPFLVTVGDGYVSDGTFIGSGYNVTQAAIDSLPDEGGTVLMKEGQYDFIDSVVIPPHVSVVGLGLGAVTIIRPRREPVFILADGYASVEGIEFHGRDGVSNGGCIELRSSSASQTIRQVTIKNNILYCENDAPGIAFAPQYNCTYVGLNINNNIFKPNTSNPVYIGEVDRGGTVSTVGMIIDSNDFQLNDTGASTAIKFDLGGTVLTDINETLIVNNNAKNSDISIGVGSDLNNIVVSGNRIDSFSVTDTITNSVITDNIITTFTPGEIWTTNLFGNIVTTNNAAQSTSLHIADGYVTVDPSNDLVIGSGVTLHISDGYVAVDPPNDLVVGAGISATSLLADGVGVRGVGGNYGTGVDGYGTQFGVKGVGGQPIIIEEELVTGLESPGGSMAVDIAGGKVYWTDSVGDTIFRANLDGSDEEELLDRSPDPIYGITLDTVGGKIYWTDGDNNRIWRANLSDGSDAEDVFVVGGVKPYGIALDVAAGKMYFTDYMAFRVYRASMNDGSDYEALITAQLHGLSNPRGIALDIAARKMYWIDEGTDKIQRASMDVVDGVTSTSIDVVEDLVIGTNNAYSIALDVAGRKMYWAAYSVNKIFRANMDGGDIEVVVDGSYPIAIALDPATLLMYWAGGPGWGSRYIKRTFVGGSIGVDGISQSIDGTGVRGIGSYGVGVFGAGNVAGVKGVGIGDAPGVTGVSEKIGVDGYGSRAGVRGVSNPVVIIPENLLSERPDSLGIDLDVAAGKMYWIESSLGANTISRANLDGSGAEELLTGLTKPRYIALDVAAEKMYWTDETDGKIYRANLDGTDKTDLVTALNSPTGVALDLVNRKIYWGDSADNSLWRANLDGTDDEEFLTQLGVNGGIALDVAAGKIYWTMYGNNSWISRANLDGTDLEEGLVYDVDYSRGIALDVAAGKMYWTDRSKYMIRRANLDGTNIADVVGIDDVWATDLALDLDAGVVYWTDGFSLAGGINRGPIGRSIGVDGVSRSTGDAGGMGVRGTGEIGVVGIGDTVGVRGICDGVVDGDGGFFSGMGAGAGVVAVSGNNLGIGVDGYGTQIGVKGAGEIGVVGTGKTGVVAAADNSHYGIGADAYGNQFGVRGVGKPVTASIDVLINDGASNTQRDIALDVAAGKVYWTDHYKIQRANLDGTDKETLITQTGVYGIALDVAAGHMYSSDTTNDKIYRSNLDGTGKIDLYATDTTRGIALDLVARKIYWCDFGYIRRGDLSGSVGSVEVVYASFFTPTPSGIALDVAAGKVYWTSTQANGPRVERANLDGTGRETLVTGMNDPRGIALDVLAGKMYWADYGDNIIYQANLDGTGIEVFNTGFGSYDIDLDLTNGYMYFTSFRKISRRHIGRSIGVDGVSQSAIGTGGAGVRGTGETGVLGLGNRVGVMGVGGDGYAGVVGIGGLDSGAGGSFTGAGAGAGVVAVSGINYGIGVDGYGNQAGIKGVGMQPDTSDVEILVTDMAGPGDIALDIAGGMMYWVDDFANGVFRANLDGGAVEEFITPVSTPTGVTLDVAAGKIYWTDESGNTVKRANLDGTDAVTLVGGLSNPTSVALDIAAGKIYWSDRGSNKIQRASWSGNNIEDLVIGLSDPWKLVLDLTAGKMYWTDIVDNSISRANLDGSYVEVLDIAGLTDPRGIALDVAVGKMYWTDNTNDNILRANLDGTDVGVVITTTATTGDTNPRGIALDIASGMMYFTTPGWPGRVFRAPMGRSIGVDGASYSIGGSGGIGVRGTGEFGVVGIGGGVDGYGTGVVGHGGEFDGYGGQFAGGAEHGHGGGVEIVGVGTCAGIITRSAGRGAPLMIVPQDAPPVNGLRGQLYVTNAGVLMIHNGDTWVSVGSQ